jgi:Secretion system C-terminal sorting domain
MKKLLSLFICFLIADSVLPQQSQNLIKNSAITGVCYAGKKINRIYIPPPDEFLKKSGSKGGGSITIYYTGFSSQAKVATEFAASILETILPADTRLTIAARWDTISTAGVLGQSSITGYAEGLGIDALNPMALYPVALAEKIAGRNLNDDLQGDLRLTINSTQPWYLGTDGKTPVGKYDLVTVVLHEICHGLGFYDSFSTDGTIGWYGSTPWIYDTFIENNSGNKLTDTLKFKNYSAALKNELTGGQLYFNGPLLTKYCQLNNYSILRAKLWAPPKWDPGSSISHLDENTTLEVNFLMTPSIDFGEAIHNPGKYTFSILGDLGWINTRIIHQPMGDTEKHLTEIQLSAVIKSDTLFSRNKVGVVFSFDKFRNSDTLFLNSQNSDNIFSTFISIPSYNKELEYYFFVEDYFQRLYKPLLYSSEKQSLEKFRYKVFIGTDTVKPVIQHTPAGYYMESIDTIAINVTATDNLAVDSVYIEYKVNNGISKHAGLEHGKADTYGTFINARSLKLNGGDSIQYRIFATDSAVSPNTSVLPESGYFKVKIEDISSTLDSYSTDFTTATSDFFNIGFNISKPAGFSKFGLNTKHPYESPEAEDKSIEYTALLRHPIKLNESGLLINFNEIVLVEPGETGSLFGSVDFYDYVILEGSKDSGKKWFSLADGYDSRNSAVWDSAYNSSPVDGNSTFVPTESMLLKHTIYIRPSDPFTGGDSLLIRFRLYSDPFANGWGWVIEDLKINPLIDAIEKVNYDLSKLYPNPGNGLINISSAGSGDQNMKPLRFSIFTTSGICIIKDRISENSGVLADISNYPAGIYIIVLYRDDGIKTYKYILLK